MELKHIPVYKDNSYRACISAAFSFLYDNIRLILSRTWIYAVAFSFLISILSILFPSPLLFYSMMLENPYIIIGVFGVLLLFFVAQLVFHSSIVALLNKRTVRWNIWRNFKVFASMLVVVGAVSVVLMTLIFLVLKHTVVADNIYAMNAIAVVVYSMLLVIFIQPFVYGMMKYIMEPAAKLRQVFTAFYVSGLRRWGFIFAVLFIVGLFIYVASYAVTFPTLVLIYARNLSEAGVIEYGDASGLPSYFPYILFTICLITSFISLYIMAIIIFAAYYIYGSISVREEMTKTKKID